MKEKVVILGYGDVGQAIAHCVKEAGYECLIEDPEKGYVDRSTENIFAIHVCIPYTYRFTTIVLLYIATYKPRLVIIESTVPPDVFYTLHKSECPIVHSPVRGSHPNLIKDLHAMTKFVSNEHPDLCRDYYFPWNIHYRIMGTAEELAVGKILSVNWYGMEIAFSQMIKKYCEEMDLDFDIVYRNFQVSTNIGLEYKWDSEKKKAVSEYDIPRPIMYPGKIGGHCVIENILLAKHHEIGNWKLWSWILEEDDSTI